MDTSTTLVFGLYVVVVWCVSTGNGKMHSVLESFVDKTSMNADKSTIGVVRLDRGVFDMMEHFATILQQSNSALSSAPFDQDNADAWSNVVTSKGIGVLNSCDS